MSAPSPPHRRTRGWRAAALSVFGLAGALFATSALVSGGHDLRGASVSDLSTLVLQQRTTTDALRAREQALGSRVYDLTRQIGREVRSPALTRLQRDIATLTGPAGLAPVRGRGLQVTLSDAPESSVRAAEANGTPLEDLAIHQQDIEAVVNALWRGGATGVSVMNQRVISTTGVRCVGNVVILHGTPYAPPYVIRAVGDPARLRRSLDTTLWIAAIKEAVTAYGLGYNVSRPGTVTLPGAPTAEALTYAKPLTRSTAG